MNGKGTFTRLNILMLQKKIKMGLRNILSNFKDNFKVKKSED